MLFECSCLLKLWLVGNLVYIQAIFSGFPGLSRSRQPPEILQRLSVATNNEENFPDESFFEMLMKCQGSRLEEQRSSLPNENQENFEDNLPPQPTANGGSANVPPANVPQPPVHAPTVPDEDFFSLIQRLQAGRLEDQRASLPGTGNGSAR